MEKKSNKDKLVEKDDKKTEEVVEEKFDPFLGNFCTPRTC